MEKKIILEKPTEEKLAALGVANWSTWECEVSAFDWEYADEEMAYVLEGKVTVRTASEEVSIQKGDLVTFPKGLQCHWTVIEPIRKVYRFNIYKDF